MELEFCDCSAAYQAQLPTLIVMKRRSVQMVSQEFSTLREVNESPLGKGLGSRMAGVNLSNCIPLLALRLHHLALFEGFAAVEGSAEHSQC